MEEMRVAIVGGLHHNTLGVIRSLGENGISKKNISVLILAKTFPEKNIITQTRYLDRSMLRTTDSEEGIIKWLLDLSKDRFHRTIICCSDAATEAVIENVDILKQYYFCPDTKLPIKQLMEKEFQGQLACECGLHVPEGMTISKNDFLEWDTFPCIIKPCKSTAGAGKADIIISKDKKELLNNIKHIKADTVQIQRFINKKMEFQLIGCSLDNGDTIIIPGFTTIIRQPPNTNTGYLLYSPINKLQIDLLPIKSFVKRIGYSGLFSIEFIRDETGKDYFLEINMRNDGNAYCVKTAGVNLPYIWCYYQTKGKLPDTPIDIKKEIHFIPDFIDYSLARHNIGTLKWIKEFMLSESHTLFNCRDMGPFSYELNKFVIGIINRKILHK
jgi:D-aspartate ligase